MQERWLDADGLRVHAVEWAAGDRPVLMVHGLGASTISWEPVGARLAEALEATVTAVDLGGFGLTRLPTGRRATVGANARLVRTLLTEHLGPAVVVGNSMGGAIGVGLAARHPELVPALVLVDPALPRSGGGLAPWRVLARFGPLMVPQVGWRVVGLRARALGPVRLVDTTLAWSIADPARVDPALRERLIARATERAAFPEAPGAFADAARSLFFYLQRRMATDLQSVERPTLVVHGALDQLVPVGAARALARRRPEFTLEVLEDCAHAPQLECPDRFLDAVVPWVSKVEAGAPRA